ncbi:lipopolysaccharide heptosyltransferase I [Ramlibacter solisilvae]|uniref:Lipopolysaccharide heptosyltransferase 1 n=1 Tax=Ramlibacter tataouinensis TaxID=94132 RepID=A0A127JWG9_9BURK|nr:lipopolysaccharide heptosyltransferase I [Ramlibacter tataouinensis]AMO24264.1 lipopolysaccharide heptosyltransferase [Ramlibacter tataouinensis]
MRILIVKLSSLGDVVHAMPAVQDLRAALPQAQVDWVVEKGFAPLVTRCEGVATTVACELRRWRKAPLATSTRAEWRAFRELLRSRAYDAVLDLQGLTKSGLVARVARLAPGGKRYALGNRTEGSSYEAPTRWLADVAIDIEPRVHAVQRSRELCARALGYPVPPGLRFGLRAQAPTDGPGRAVCLVHGTSRADKCWPEAHWVALGQRLLTRGFTIGLPHGSEAERERSERIAAELGGGAQVWPRLELGALADRLASCAGVVGVDSGLSHIAVALDLPHVQIYNFDTAWRTGPLDALRQRAVYAQPTPSVDAVWQAWQAVEAVGPAP